MSAVPVTEPSTSSTTAPARASSRPSPLARVLLALLWVYRQTALVRPARCRFHPTCSQYAVDSVRLHGALKGSWLAVRRIGRCHPFNPGGVDHVPPPRSRKSDT